MGCALIPTDLVFIERLGSRTTVRSTRYQVTFARGSIIDCATDAEARDMVRQHLERAAHHHIEESIVEAVRLIRRPV